MAQVQSVATSDAASVHETADNQSATPGINGNVNRASTLLSNFTDHGVGEEFPKELTEHINGAGKALGAVGRIAGPAVFALDGYRLGKSVSDDGGQFGAHTKHTVGSVAGGIGGEVAGAAIGEPIGQTIGGLVGALAAGPLGVPVGEAVGGAGGALVGSVIGSLAGSGIGADIADRFFGGQK